MEDRSRATISAHSESPVGSATDDSMRGLASVHARRRQVIRPTRRWMCESCARDHQDRSRDEYSQGG